MSECSDCGESAENECADQDCTDFGLEFCNGCMEQHVEEQHRDHD